MLRSLKDLESYKVNATDGNIGSAVDFLLDDQYWTVRYLLVDTRGIFTGHKVLISPASFGRAEWSTQCFHLALTKDKVKSSPGVDTDKPVCRQHERDHCLYYGHPFYWGLTAGPSHAPDESSDNYRDVHLRSAVEVRGYRIQARDDDIGYVDDFIIDDQSWEVRYLVIDTRDKWLGRKVLVAPSWTSRVSWEERAVYLDMSRQAIEDSPEWRPSEAVNREYEARLYDYYGRPVYWSGTGRVADLPPPS